MGERTEMNTQNRVTRPKSLKAKGPSPEVGLGFRWGLVNSVLLGLGVGAVTAGYVYLAQGSITLAPVLLVSGYCGFLPAALLVRGGVADSGE
jgi:hypothetical protein